MTFPGYAVSSIRLRLQRRLVTCLNPQKYQWEVSNDPKTSFTRSYYCRTHGQEKRNLRQIGHYCVNYYLNNFLPGTCRDRNQTFFAFLFCECASGFLFIIVRYIGTAAFTGTSPVCSFAKGLPFGHSLISYLSVRTEGHKIGLGWVLL